MPNPASILSVAPRNRRRKVELPGPTLSGAELLALARKGGFGRNLDMVAVKRAYATRRRRVRAG